MKFLVTGLLLLILVVSTLGDVLPRLRPLEQDPHPIQQEDVQHGRPHKNIGDFNIGSCQDQYVNCLLNSNGRFKRYTVIVMYANLIFITVAISSIMHDIIIPMLKMIKWLLIGSTI